MKTKASRRFFAPEVVQTSAMDCGPASLKCLLEGFGIHVSYGRLREACQTDVDGTSIDTMEEIARQLGLEAEQIMVPADHVLLPESGVLPAITVVRLAQGITHFVVAWRSHGPVIQLMDPGTGRRWPTREKFLGDLYIHEMQVPAASWLEWAQSTEFLGAFGRRLANLGISAGTREGMIDAALAEPGWRPIAALDAATRMTEAIVRSGGLARGRPASRVIERFAARAKEQKLAEPQNIPAAYWTVRATPPRADVEEQVLLRGAVLVHIGGKRATTRTSPAAAPGESPPAQPALSPELAAALNERPSRPGLELFRLLRADGILAPSALLLALMLAAAGVIVEALLFRGLFDIGWELSLTGQRIGAIVAVVLFLMFLLFLELPISRCVWRFGRLLEARLRIAFLQKIPRLGDRYFHSRLTSDMAARCHDSHRIRLLPELGGQFLRSIFQLVLTTLGIAWLDPVSAPLAVLAAVGAVAFPMSVQPILVERDLRARNHSGALSRFYLDGLLGLVAVRVHGAEKAVRREHESLLAEWSRAALGLQRSVVAVEGLQFVAGFGLAAWLLVDHLARNAEAGAALLLAYWALNLPVLGQEISLMARQYPSERNVTLRLLEPLGAMEETAAETGSRATLNPASLPAERSAGVKIAFEGVGVKVAGHTILDGLNFSAEPGSHIAIVGPSGAGKSSLVGVLLGWHRPSEGRVLVDDEPLDGARLERLRRETAWVDPAVQLWNRSLAENLSYGSDNGLPIALAIEAAQLRDLLEKLPDGLQTSLGEGGALVSGGEGQRVRLGRAILRSRARLILLDEPFRGLDREQRRKLLGQARRLWSDRTLLCVTHDVSETQSFDRVLVVEGGRVVEDSAPGLLAGQEGTRYRAMLEAEEAVRTGLWSSDGWRSLSLRDGLVVE